MGLSARALRARSPAHLLRRTLAQRSTDALGASPASCAGPLQEMRRGGSRREPALSPRAVASASGLDRPPPLPAHHCRTQNRYLRHKPVLRPVPAAHSSPLLPT